MENVDLNYFFSINNNLDTFNSHNIVSEFKVNNFVTEFNYIEQNGEIGQVTLFQIKHLMNLMKITHLLLQLDEIKKLT